jgi:hypothetical protein
VNAQTTVCCEHVPRIADKSMLQETLVDSLVPGKTKGEKIIIRGRSTDLDTIVLSFTPWRLVGAVGWRRQQYGAETLLVRSNAATLNLMAHDSSEYPTIKKAAVHASQSQRTVYIYISRSEVCRNCFSE